MFKTVNEAVLFVKEFKIVVKDIAGVEIVVAPPFTALHAVAEAVRNTNIGVAAQNVEGLRSFYHEPRGDLSAAIDVEPHLDPAKLRRIEPDLEAVAPALGPGGDLDREPLRPQRAFEPGREGVLRRQPVARGQRIAQRHDLHRPIGRHGGRRPRQDHGEQSGTQNHLDRRRPTPI